MKRETARICLTVAVVLFVAGWFVLGHAPEWFGLTAMFAVVPVLLGARWVRIVGGLLMIASVAAAIAEYRAGHRLQERVREIRLRAPG